MLSVLLLNRMRARRQVARKKLRKTAQKVNIAKRQENIVVSEQVVEYCRTCLISTNLVDIFYSEDTARKRSEDLKTVTGVEITLNDGLSQKMCTKCMETLNSALHFRIISVKNDQKLRNALKNLNENFKTRTEEVEFLEESENEADLNVDKVNSDGNSEIEQSIEFIEGLDYFETDVNEGNSQQNHDNTEGPDTVYKCNICDKEYSKRRTFKAHLRSHSYSTICEECGKLCFCRSQLLEHKRAAHSLPRVHTCSRCDYSSATKAGLVVHERRHTDSRDFVCDQCGARFLSRDGLVQHLPIHRDESSFECDLCHKREKSKRLLQHHHYKVHREKRLRYLCPVCQTIFKSITGVRQHLIRSHDVPREDQPAIQRFQIPAPDTTEDG